MKRRKIAVVTGTRAEFGLLKPVIDRLYERTDTEVLTVVTGAHLSEKLGGTVSEIIRAGINIDEKIDIGAGEPDIDNIESLTRAVSGFYRYFTDRKPDATLLLGDRYEIFGAALASVSAGVPVAHISGGDVTEGARDEYYRHCITKMSSLHFPSCEAYRRRVIQLGEQPDTVFNVGSLGAENIEKLPLLDRDELSEQIDFDCSKPYFVITYHPETLTETDSVTALNELLNVIEKRGSRAIITKSNADDGADAINLRLERFADSHDGIKLVTSLGVLRYLSAMKYCTAVIGNSSSGIVETPSFKKPTLDIGDRQKGRLKGANTVHCGRSQEEIEQALDRILSAEFAYEIQNMENPYRSNGTSKQIADILLEFVNGHKLKIQKSFYDL